MEKEKVIKYAKKYWWALLIALCCIISPLLPKEPQAPRDYVKEANNIQDEIAKSYYIKDVVANLDSAARLLAVMKEVNDADSNFVSAKNDLDSTVTYRDAVYAMLSHKIKLRDLFGVGGKCIPLSKIIKNGMNNPESYEFVDSDCKAIDNDTFLVTETCRGTNSYGGVITVTYQAVVTIDGDVTSLKQL